MCQRGNGAQQSCRAAAIGNQEAKEHAQPSGAVICRCPPYALTSLHDELSQAARGQLAGILAMETDQFSNRSSVIGQCSVGRAALIPHPVTERLQQSGSGAAVSATDSTTCYALRTMQYGH